MKSPALSSIARDVPDVDLLRALAVTNREALERMITIGIDILDALDPDPDLEPEEDGACDEDEISTGFHALRNMPGPGCAISDCDSDEHYKPAWQSPEGRAFVNARRVGLGLLPIRSRR